MLMIDVITWWLIAVCKRVPDKKVMIIRWYAILEVEQWLLSSEYRFLPGILRTVRSHPRLAFDIEGALATVVRFS